MTAAAVQTMFWRWVFEAQSWLADGVDCSKYSSERYDSTCVERREAFMGILAVTTVVLAIVGFVLFQIFKRRVLRRLEERERLEASTGTTDTSTDTSADDEPS